VLRVTLRVDAGFVADFAGEALALTTPAHRPDGTDVFALAAVERIRVGIHTALLAQLGSAHAFAAAVTTTLTSATLIVASTTVVGIFRHVDAIAAALLLHGATITRAGTVGTHFVIIANHSAAAAVLGVAARVDAPPRTLETIRWTLALPRPTLSVSWAAVAAAAAIIDVRIGIDAQPLALFETKRAVTLTVEADLAASARVATPSTIVFVFDEVDATEGAGIEPGSTIFDARATLTKRSGSSASVAARATVVRIAFHR
jgi:hypothetical protein